MCIRVIRGPIISFRAFSCFLWLFLFGSGVVALSISWFHPLNDCHFIRRSL